MKHMTVTELRDRGILQALNLEFFHPLGLAAEVDTLNNNIAILQIQDWREDPEGVVYGEMDAEKHFKFLAFRDQKYAERLKRLGFILQPAPEDRATAPTDILARSREPSE